MSSYSPILNLVEPMYVPRGIEGHVAAGCELVRAGQYGPRGEDQARTYRTYGATAISSVSNILETAHVYITILSALFNRSNGITHLSYVRTAVSVLSAV